MATALADSSIKDGQECPICLDRFTVPRELPCLHSFCEHCLQDYITKKAGSTDKTFEEFMCPVCRAVTRPANKEKPVREWASLFPNSPFPLVGKSKVERPCEVCFSSSDSSTDFANKFCVVCEEFMCDNCTLCHQNMKISKRHKIITIEEWENNPENRIRFSEGYGCPEHDNEDIKFYCMSHEAACCGTCSFLYHRTCKDVHELKQSLPYLLKDINSQKIMEQMRTLEDHLKSFMKINEENVGILESRVKNISAEIEDFRLKMNALLDDIEKTVKLEGNRIYKEWMIRKQEQNHQCQSLVSAIRNSQALLEAVVQFGSDTQKYIVTSKMMKQLQCYRYQIQEKFKRMDSIRIKLELDGKLRSILSQDAVGLVKIAFQEEVKDLNCTSSLVPLQIRTVAFSRVVSVHCPYGKKPAYRGIVQFPGGYIVLSDHVSNTLYLYDSSHTLVASHTLLGTPYDMCLMGDTEVAVTLYGRTMQFLSISDRSITDTGMVKTKYECCGVDAVNSQMTLVSGHCGDTRCSSNKCYWSLITRDGKENLYHEFDCQTTYDTYVAQNISRSRVYISVSGANAVYCFGLRDGKQYFVYLSKELICPMGVAVDREDNVYVAGYFSNNIHKLSPDGVTLQVITSGVPKTPRRISFNHSRDRFVVTNESQQRRKLHYFVHK